jgi:hypothetical protein
MDARTKTVGNQTMTFWKKAQVEYNHDIENLTGPYMQRIPNRRNKNQRGTTVGATIIEWS